MSKAIKVFPKKKDRKTLRVNRWNERNRCPQCNCIYDKNYLKRWGVCMNCYMENVGMSWSDFI